MNKPFWLKLKLKLAASPQTFICVSALLLFSIMTYPRTYDQLVKDFDMKIQKLVKDLDESHNYFEKKLQDLTFWLATLETTADSTALVGMLEKAAEKTVEKMTEKITEKVISFVTDAVMMKVDTKKDVMHFEERFKSLENRIDDILRNVRILYEDEDDNEFDKTGLVNLSMTFLVVVETLCESFWAYDTNAKGFASDPWLPKIMHNDPVTVGVGVTRVIMKTGNEPAIVDLGREVLSIRDDAPTG